MNNLTDELYSMLVPLHDNRLIVPRSCVAEVIRYTRPEEEPDEDSWLHGFVSWNDKPAPVISFERLCGLASAGPGGRTRIAIFSGISDELEAGVFGVLTEGFPQLVRVNRDVIHLDDRHSWPDDGPVICQIRMINEYPLIPDLERVEQLIAGRLATGRPATA